MNLIIMQLHNTSRKKIDFFSQYQLLTFFNMSNNTDTILLNSKTYDEGDSFVGSLTDSSTTYGSNLEVCQENNNDIGIIDNNPFIESSSIVIIDEESKVEDFDSKVSYQNSDIINDSIASNLKKSNSSVDVANCKINNQEVAIKKSFQDKLIEEQSKPNNNSDLVLHSYRWGVDKRPTNIDEILMDPFIKVAHEICTKYPSNIMNDYSELFCGLAKRMTDNHIPEIISAINNNNINQISIIGERLKDEELIPFVQSVYSIMETYWDKNNISVLKDYTDELGNVVALVCITEFGDTKLAKTLNGDIYSGLEQIWHGRRDEIERLCNFFSSKASSKVTGNKCYLEWKQKLDQGSLRIAYVYDPKLAKEIKMISNGEYKLIEQKSIGLWEALFGGQ